MTLSHDFSSINIVLVLFLFLAHWHKAAGIILKQENAMAFHSVIMVFRKATAFPL